MAKKWWFGKKYTHYVNNYTYMCAKSSTFAVAFIRMPENVNKTNNNNNQKNSTNMKKILSFILLGLMCSIGNLWAVDFTLYSSESSFTSPFPLTNGGVTISVNNAENLNIKNGSSQCADFATQYSIPSTKIYMISLKGSGMLTIDAGANNSISSITMLVGRNSSGASVSQFGHGGFSNDNNTWSEIGALSAKGYDKGSEITVTPTGSYRYYTFGRAKIGDTTPSANAEARVYFISVSVSANTAPTITTDLEATENVAVGVPTDFSIVASGATSYQWYTCDDSEGNNPVAILGATSASYSYEAEAAGTIYLYCVATNALGSATSTICAVTASVVATHSVTYAWGIRATDLEGLALPSQDDVAEGYNFAVAALPTVVKYDFLGWNDGVNTYAAGADYTMSTEDVVLTALWAAPLEQVSVSEATTWDWANAGTSNHQLGNDTYPSSNSEFVMANLSGIPNDANFNSQALLVTTQFANRGNNSYFQGNVIKFTTTIPGFVKVWFQNTNNRSDSQANRRFVYVNGINSNVYSLRQDAWVETPAMAVAAGEVIINAFTGEEDATMVRIKKIVFTPTEITLGANGYSTYAADFKYTVSGAEVYKAAYNEQQNAVVLTEVENAVVPAGEGIILKGTEGATATITLSNDDASDFEGNDLEGVVSATTAPADAYALATNLDGDGLTKFHPCTDIEIPANKAYIVIAAANPAPAVRIIFAENGATGINELEGAEKAVKFIENGKLYIQKDGVVYDATGAKVK